MPRFLWIMVDNSCDGGHGQAMSAALADLVEQLRDLVVDLAALAHEGLDLLDRVDDRGVITTTELTCDGRIGQVGQIPEDVHGDLAGGHQRPLAALALELLDGEVEVG